MRSKLLTKALRPLARAYMKRNPEDAFQLALKPLGYNNYKAETSGEKYFIENIVSKLNPKLCFDIGANSGGYSRRLLEATEAQVIAFEPLPIMAETLENLRAKFDQRLKIENCGVGEKSQKLSVHFSNDASSHASFLIDANNINYVSNNEEVTVDVVTLDDYIAQNSIGDIDLVKIDVEGFEARVLDGAAQTIAKSPPKIIQIENNIHQLLAQESIYSISMRLKDFALYQLLPQSMVPRDPLSPEANLFVFSNFVFIRRDIVPLIDI